MLWKMMARSLHFYSYGLRYTVGHSLAFFVYFVLSQMLLSVLSEESTIFTNCGGTLHDPKGVIFTPNFPHAYPIPISCKWKIEAPGNQMIAIYFTQFYMREGLRATEYAYFEDESHYMGKTDLGLVSFDSHVNHLVTNKTILVLEFTVLEPGNIHLRVIDLFLDVYGFNITYEMISKNDYHLDPCINNHCTFNGNCLASADFSSYQCQCLQEFYGDECQFSPKCGPGAESAICYNEGTCRHYIGSRFRMCNCPPGYQGTRCEKRVDEDPFISKEYFDEESTKYTISFKLFNKNLDHHRYQLHLESALSSLFKPYILKNVENLTALHFKPDAIVQFHFFGQKDDDEGIKRIVEGVLRKGQIGRYGVDRNYVQFQQEPSLSILNVEASQKMPVVEGAEISLRCIILGSNNIKVRWFKDRYPINIDQENRTWTTIIPQASKHHYTAILKISKVHHLDSGTFTCKATNWGIVREQKLEIEVISSPEISIFPLSLTIKEGDKAVITCLSKDISSRKVGYSWLKDGRILNPSKQPEHIEDIFPTGSRLIVHTVKKSAIYSCILTNFAGMTRADSSVMVLDKTRNIPTCLPEEYQDFEWNLTLANSDHIKYCGGGYKGIVRRHCSLRAKAAASWEEPDFSNCLSEEFLKIDKEFEKLKLGYLENNVSTIIATLRNFLETRIKMMHYREGAPIVDLLQKIDSYQQHYFVNHKQVMDTAEALLDIASFLLINSYIIHKQSYVIQLHQLILNHGFLRGSFSTPGTFQVFDRPAFVLQTGRVTKDGQHNLKFPDFPENLKDSSITTFERDKMQADNQRISSKHPWLTDELEVSYNTFLMSDFDHLNDSIVTTVVFYKNLSVFLPPRFLIRKGDHDIETQLCSSMMAVILKSRQQMTGFQLNDVKVKLSLKSKISIKIGVQNVSCAVVSFAEGKFKFHLDGCQQTQEGSYIVCICNQTGLFAALATVVNSARHTHGRFDVIVGIGCALCICLVLVTVLILLVFWRRIKGPLTALKIQSCVAILGTYSCFLGALYESFHKEYYPHVVSLVMFFLLAAICMHLCMELTICMEFVQLKTIQHLEKKIAAIGWAVPVIVVGATLAAQVLEGFDLDSWWLLIGTSFFYAFVTSGAIIVVLYILLYLTVKAELRRQKKVNPQHQIKILNRTGMLRRSFFIFLLLLLVATSSILFTNFEENIFNYFFSVSSSLLGIFIFLFYTIKSENVSKIYSIYTLCDLFIMKHHQIFQCFSSKKKSTEDDDAQFERNSFKKYVKPETMKDSPYYLDSLEELPNEKVLRTKLQVETYSYKKNHEERNHLLCNDTRGNSHHTLQKLSVDSESGETDTENEETMSGTPAHFQSFQSLFQGTSNPVLFELQSLEGSPKSTHMKDSCPLVSAGGKNYNKEKSTCHTTTSFISQSTSSCQPHNVQLNVAQSVFSESGSSNSSSLEEQSALYVPANSRLGSYIPYKPSNLLQHEEPAISEEDENDESQASTIKPVYINMNTHTSSTLSLKENHVSVPDKSDNHEKPAKERKASLVASKEDPIAESLISSTHFSASENNKVPTSYKTKSWSITAV